MTVSANRKYLPEVDHIRAYAALLVMLYHGLQIIGTYLKQGTGFEPAKDWLFTTNPAMAVIEEGHTGVSAFIVLSGFILSVGAIGHGIDYRKFIMARILRIYPLYIVFLFVGVYANTNATTVFSLVTSILPFANVPGGVGGPFTAMFWAVAVEFQCYLVFPFLLAFSNARGSRFLWQVIAIAVLLRLVAVLPFDSNARDLSYWSVVGRIDQFCLGMIAARLYVNRGWVRHLHPAWALASTAAIVGVLVGFNQAGGWPSVAPWKVLWPTVEGLMWAAFIVTYLPAGRALPSLLNRAIARLGEVSYSSYIAHMLFIHVALHYAPVHLVADGQINGVLTTLFVVFPLTTAFAFLTYSTIEKPFLSMRKRYVIDLPPVVLARAA